ncbi:hypothetical protein EDB92DRAFT_1875632 [Lactarius akahatsu]|uniref:MINDY deubiquitinase domain-containing protein n=1 Tax=Lactarius akahatsu TaxID=416441 RepID=A0AAD4LFB3_9AGAM|nr:hypothetical protein EDB92DRAFT_1875632 [Lactarius akahatsu]
MQSPAELESALDKLTISPNSEQQPPHTTTAHPPTSDHHPESDAEPSEHDTSTQDIWYLKTIDFTSPSGTRRSYNIITQNYNGPCSFIAICNILILREQIEILPRDRKSVSYEFLAQLVGEYILLTAPEVDVSAALSMMPLTTKGMDLNPVFTSATAFRPATTGGELALFASAGITLVHGWLVDPASSEYAAVSHAGDYDSAVNLIVEADVLTRGLLVSGSGYGDGAGPSSPNINLTDEERRKVEDAVAIRTFLDSTRSQLTYHGLFTLASLQPGSKSEPSPSASASEPTATSIEPPQHPHPELFAHFRNSHLAVLYRHADALYTLVTDQVFLNEPSVVWERLEDVDQGAAVFVDSSFERATPVGGDWAGWTPASEAPGIVDPADRELALQLQNAEDEKAQRVRAKWEEERLAQRRRDEGATVRPIPIQHQPKRKEKHRKENNCLIM